jgi:hypothetical protein
MPPKNNRPRNKSASLPWFSRAALALPPIMPAPMRRSRALEERRIGLQAHPRDRSPPPWWRELPKPSELPASGHFGICRGLRPLADIRGVICRDERARSEHT